MDHVRRHSLLLLHPLKYLEQDRTQHADANEANFILYCYLLNYLTSIFIDKRNKEERHSSKLLQSCF